MSTQVSGGVLHEIAEKLCQRPVLEISEGSQGGNSRILKICTLEEKFALKFYRATSVGQLSRLATESLALRFFEQNGISVTPRWIASDTNHNCSLLEWINGRALPESDDKFVVQAIDFLTRLHGLRYVSTANAFPMGTEACLSGEELSRQLCMRLNKLMQAASNHGQLYQFIRGQFEDAVRTILDWAQASYRASKMDFAENLDRSRLTLSPVDFGFHNLLRRNDGSGIFIDFEYFGWADPANLIADTLQHPGMSLSGENKMILFRKLLAIYDEDETLYNRLRILYPVYGLRWCAIMLNPFLPGYDHPGVQSRSTQQKIQWLEERLAKVKMLTEDLSRTYHRFPYDE